MGRIKGQRNSKLGTMIGLLNKVIASKEKQVVATNKKREQLLAEITELKTELKQRSQLGKSSPNK